MKARIRDQRRPGIGNKRDVQTGFDLIYEFTSALAFIMFVIADGRLRDLIMRQELSSVPGVFASDEIDFFENAQRTEGDVFQITYRRSDDVEGTWHYHLRAWESLEILITTLIRSNPEQYNAQ